MIHMPRRSVTRFFIPLIDVLFLLFCIFLLMPVFSEEESAGGPSPSQLAAEDLMQELDLVKKALENMRREKEQALKRSIYIRLIDIDGKTGDISYYDPVVSDRPIPIPDEKKARTMIDRDRREAGDRLLYYQFVFPRPETDRPTEAQELTYRRWFAGVANSLEVKTP